MKKLTTAMALVLGLGFAIAQQTTPAAKAQATPKTTKMTKAPEAKAADTKTAKPAKEKKGMTDKKAAMK
ncbi:hypothetical protein C1637_03680 [Chryseobacterium lactis]|uniref:Pentapeptide MXKDX repeat protein n=1 Tax=Chryseobacterium lactis TaxID=1241981 RepID=A0A3G6RP41_CHRLC|nr:hypothetical protein [Chryseobacterium lactis]AZA81687.1 hypothetical protein EG342_07075 [Chryseobacterium lactis]AZB06685.1 hypothetical protein EG341_23195 [Chryseobacterium lactis]PNW15536.1 hypothetical protein C1637_03680 [Chryseobacterium lactis]